MSKLAVGELPEGWRVASLKRALHGVSQGWSPQCENRPAETAEWGVLKVGCVNGLTFDPTENKALPPELEPDLSCVIQKGDVLVSRANTRELVGLAAIVQHDHPNLLLCDKLYRLRLRSEWAVPAFVVRALRSELTRHQIELEASGASTSMQNISQDVLRELRMVFPPVKLQKAIAEFLDEKTARIDALIEEKERLLETVHEYASAEISRLLTAGTRAHAMRATNRAVLPFAPAGWRVAAFKRALLGIGQGWSPQCESRPAEDGEWGVLKVGCVNGTRFNADENKALPSDLQPDLSCLIKAGDVLVSRANTRELVGMAALVEEEHPNLMLCDKLYRLALRTDWILPEFAVLALRSESARRQIELGASGASASMQNISQDVIRELVVAFPPLDEQVEILQQSAVVRQRTTSLAEHAEEHINRLREYRSSLISAAVTGQLNVG